MHEETNQESLGIEPRDSFFERIALAVRLREGAKGVENFLQQVAQQRSRTLNELARNCGLPVPVAAAVRRELEKEKVLDRRQGLRLTKKGEALIGPVAGTVMMPCPTCQGMGTRLTPEFLELLPEIESICEQRPEVDVTLDQALATPETNLYRAAYFLSNFALQDKRIVFLGDDDFTSLAVAMAVKKTFPADRVLRSILVLDIDARILDRIQSIAREKQLPVETYEQDFRKQPQAKLPEAQIVFCDPPYTEEAVNLYCQWARMFLPHENGSFLVCYPYRDPGTLYHLQAIWQLWGLVPVDFKRNWNRYEGNSMHSGSSCLWHLITVTESQKQTPSVQKPVGSIYTHDRKTAKNRGNADTERSGRAL